MTYRIQSISDVSLLVFWFDVWLSDMSGNFVHTLALMWKSQIFNTALQKRRKLAHRPLISPPRTTCVIISSLIFSSVAVLFYKCV